MAAWLLLAFVLRDSALTLEEKASAAQPLETRRFATFYYRDPKPHELASNLEQLLKSDIWKQGRLTVADDESLAYFFARAAYGDPNIVEDYTKLFEGVMHRPRIFLLRILWRCGNEGTREYFQNMVRMGRFGNERPEIDAFLRGNYYRFDVMETPVDSVSDLWILLTEFTTAGNEAAISKIIEALTYERREMTTLDVEDLRHPDNVRAVATKLLEMACRLHPRVLDVCKGEYRSSSREMRSLLEDIIESADGSISEHRWLENPPANKPVTGARGWAISCAAVLVEYNHERHNTLNIHPIRAESIATEKKALEEWWGIKSKSDLVESLEWLKSRGHRVYFEKTGQYVNGLTEKEFQELLASCGNNNEKRQEYSIARQYYGLLGEKGILGWDYSRYIFLCRDGYTIGFLTEDEAWDRIMPIARTLQRTFDSWEDLGKNYLIGRQFWSHKQTMQSGADFEDAFERLLEMKSSPWNNYSWNMNLDAREPGEESQSQNSTGTEGSLDR